MDLHQLHHFVQRQQRRGTLGFLARFGDIVQRVVDVQPRRKQAHQQANGTQDEEFLQQAEAVK